MLCLTLVTGGSPTAVDLAWGVVAGVGNGFGTAFLYRGLSSGRMGVVAPVSGVGAAVLPVVVGVATGERPRTLVWLRAAAPCRASGWWPVSRPRARPGGTGLTDGVLAGLGFGSLFAALAQIPEEAGFLPLALNQLVAAVAIAVVAVVCASRGCPATGTRSAAWSAASSARWRPGRSWWPRTAAT